MRLLKFELKKLMGRRAVLIALILFSAINLSKIYDVYQSYSSLSSRETAKSELDWKAAYWELYPELKGEITQERIDRLLSLYRPAQAKVADHTATTALNQPGTMTGNFYSDFYFLDKYYLTYMEHFYNYRGGARTVTEKALANIALYEECGNLYEARKNAVIYNLYAGREIKNFEYTESVKYCVNYDFSTVLVLLVCVYSVVSVFVREKETQMAELLLTNPKGGRETARAKLLASSLFVVAVSLWFSLMDVLGFALVPGTWDGWGLPVYAIVNLSSAAVNLSLWQYAILSALIKALGVWVLAMLVLWLSRFFENALVPFVAGLLSVGGLVVLGSLYAYSGNVAVKALNPATLLTNRVLLGKTEICGSVRLSRAKLYRCDWNIRAVRRVLRGLDVYASRSESNQRERRPLCSGLKSKR